MVALLNGVMPKEGKNWFWLLVLAVIAVWPWFAGVFALHLAILTCLNILIVNGLSIIGRCGQRSFGHAAFAVLMFRCC